MRFFQNMLNDNNRRYRCEGCGRRMQEDERTCPKCGMVNSEAGWIVPGRNQCGNCHEKLSPDDRYCPYCGTRVGEGEYEPYKDIMQAIYGPMPEERCHLCVDCGYLWKTCLMIDNQRYCPRCGSGNLSGSMPGLVLLGLDKPSMVRITMKAPELTIGRMTTLANVKDSAVRSVSREHCKLLWKEGQFYLMDMNSTNGTSLNGKWLDSGRMAPLHAGDKVCFGRCHFRVEIVDAGETCP